MEKFAKDPSAKKNAIFSPKQKLVSALLATSVLAGCSGDNNLDAGKPSNDQYRSTPIAGNETPGSPEASPQTVYENVLDAGEEKLGAPYLEGLSGSELQNQVEQYLISYAGAQTEIMQALSEANGEDFYYETPDMPDTKLSTTDPEKPTPEAAMVITYVPGYSGTSNAGGEFNGPAMLRFGSSMGSDSAVINFELNSSEPIKNFSDVQKILESPEQHNLTLYSVENEYEEALYITDDGMETINAAGVKSTEFSDSSIQQSRVGDTWDTILEVRDQLARPGSERTWGELSNEEKFQSAGVDFTLDFAQKMAESEHTETTSSAMPGFGNSFNADITIPKANPREDLYPEDYETRTSEGGEETFCLKEETEYCEEPEDIIRMSMQQYPDGEGGGMISANAFLDSELHGDNSQRLTVDLTYSKESPLSGAENPADVAEVLLETKGENTTVDSLSAPAVGMDINYTFYKDEEGGLTENHDTGAITGEFQNFGEHLESAISSLRGDAKGVYGFGESDAPSGEIN